jgi:hypothetical protein
MKSIIFWDMTPCSPLNFNQRFGGTYASIYRVQEISSAKNQQASRCYFFDLEDGGDMFFRNIG